VDSGLGELGVNQALLHGLHALAEIVDVEFLETGTGDGGVELDTFEQGVNLKVGLSAGRKGTLSTLASSAETT
jgi:hypothetical protein